MHLNSKLLFEKYAIPYFKSNQKVLEIGPTGYPSYYSKLVGSSSIEWQTLDIHTDYIDQGESNPLHIISQEEYHYPVEDDTYDIVLSGQVMEHVQNIWIWLDELKRITKPGGFIIIISPISWSYHEAPVDCWRIYPAGMNTLMKEKGLEVVECLFDSLEKKSLNTSNFTEPGNSIFKLDGQLPNRWKVIQKMHKIPFFNRFIRRIPVSYDNICISKK